MSLSQRFFPFSCLFHLSNTLQKLTLNYNIYLGEPPTILVFIQNVAESH